MLFNGIHSESVISLTHSESAGLITSDSKPPSPPAFCFPSSYYSHSMPIPSNPLRARHHSRIWFWLHTCRVKSMVKITSIASQPHT